MIPLYGFLEGDTMGLLVLAEASDTMVTLAAKLTTSARVRVTPRRGGRVVFNGRAIEPTATVAHAGMEALDRFDVVHS